MIIDNVTMYEDVIIDFLDYLVPDYATACLQVRAER